MPDSRPATCPRRPVMRMLLVTICAGALALTGVAAQAPSTAEQQAYEKGVAEAEAARLRYEAELARRERERYEARLARHNAEIARRQAAEAARAEQRAARDAQRQQRQAERAGTQAAATSTTTAAATTCERREARSRNRGRGIGR